MLYTYSFANRKRDLSDIMSTVIKDEPRFISNFRTGADAVQRKHEWVEDQLSGRGFTASAISDSTLTLPPADAAKAAVGMLIAVKDDPALFRVVKVESNALQIELVSNNGSQLTGVDSLPAEGADFIIVSLR